MTSRWSVCALALLLGCSGSKHEGNTSVCSAGLCPCTEAGIRAAIAEGGGPFAFDCQEPTTVATEAEIEIENDVILDGGGILSVDGANDHAVFSVSEGATVELHGFRIIGGRATAPSKLGAGIHNDGDLTVVNTTISANRQTSSDGGAGVSNRGTLNLSGVTVSGSRCHQAGCGIWNEGMMSLVNSTVSETGCRLAVCTAGALSLEHSTVSNPERVTMDLRTGSLFSAARSIIDGGCSTHQHGSGVASFGGNVESPGDTCGFGQTGDQAGVGGDDLKLGPLQDNGGSTETHAVGAGSVAIDQIPAVDCVDAEGAPLTTDQRGEPRDSMCDVGAFEVQP